MPDRLFYPLAAIVAIGLIALASVWPQGQGARSPRPFGHSTWAETHPAKPPAAAGAPARAAPLRGPF